MAQAARVDLDGGHTRFLHGDGVDVGGDVALDHGAAIAVAQALVGRQDGRGLAGAGAGKHVHHKDLMLGKALAQLGRQALVARQDGALDTYGLLGHGSFFLTDWLMDKNQRHRLARRRTWNRRRPQPRRPRAVHPRPESLSQATQYPTRGRAAT